MTQARHIFRRATADTSFVRACSALISTEKMAYSWQGALTNLRYGEMILTDQHQGAGKGCGESAPNSLIVDV